MKTQPPPIRPSDAGSLPLAMLITVFCIVLSMLALSGLVLQATRSQAADAEVASQLANDSGVAVAGQKMASQTAGLCNVPYQAPDTFEPAPGDSKAGFRWWVDKTDIANGKVKAIVETNSGNPRAPSVTSTSLGYTWDAAANRWQITSRKGEEVHPYPETGNFFRVTTPARFTSTPDNRGLGLALNPGQPNASDSPSLNDAILTDGRYVWLAGEFSVASGADGSSSTSNIVKMDTSTGQVVETFSVTLGDPANDYISSMIFVGDDIVVGGKFTSVNSTARNHLAKINKDTGAVIAGFNDGQRLGVQYGPTQRVITLAYDDARDAIVVGGVFTGWVTPSVNGPKPRFAVVDPTTGIPVDSGVQADPNFTQPVEHLAVVGGEIVAGGRLYAEGNPLWRALVTVAADGSVTDTGMDVTRGGYTGLLRDLAVDPAHPGQLVAGFGYASGGGEIATPEMVRMFRVSDGATLWTTPTGHDVHTVAWVDGLVYANIHNGTNFGDPTTRLFALNDATGVQNTSFKPTFPAWDGADYANYWGATKLAVSTQGLAAFGAFTDVSGESVSNFAWFPNRGGC